MRPNDLRLPGAVDLSGLKRPATSPQQSATSPQQAGTTPGATAPAGGLIVDVTEATFEAEVINRSMQVPVVLDFWATWCEPCKQLSPVLEALATEYAGRWVLAKIDVDAEQRLGQAFQVQSIPTVMAVIGGQPVPLFQGAVPEAQARQVIDEVLKVAAANGMAGTVSPAGDDDAGPPPPLADPEYDAAQAALDRGDLEAAVAAFRVIAERSPGDAEAAGAVARVELLVRTQGADEPAVRARAAAEPDDVAAQIAVADLDMLRGDVDASISRLVELVRRTSEDERDQARQHLIALFNVLVPEDPRLAAGRRALANALY
jgi:putative thioredoxin